MRYSGERRVSVPMLMKTLLLAVAVLATAAGAVVGAGVAAAPAAAETLVKNYAGPSAGCPGADWNCTTNTDGVAQVGDVNRVECTSTPCSATQTGSRNEFTCKPGVVGGTGNRYEQSCRVVQRANGNNLDPSNAENVATIDMSITATQTCGAPQTTTCVQQLDAYQNVHVEQYAAGQAGNKANVSAKQTLDQVSTELIAGALLDSNQRLGTSDRAGTDRDYNVDSFVEQHAALGTNDLTWTALLDYGQECKSLAARCSQLIGRPGNGIASVHDQFADVVGNSTYTANANKTWDQTASSPQGSIEQTEDDQIDILGIILGKTPDSGTAKSTSTLSQSSVNGNQACNEFTRAKFRQAGTVDHKCDLNGQLHDKEATRAGQDIRLVTGTCRGTPQFCAERDSDGVADRYDNCPDVANPDQSDIDDDGIGDACDPVQNIAIDVKPGSTDNNVSLSQGVLPVAVLSTPTFNAPASVDVPTLLFGATGNEASLDYTSGDQKPHCTTQDTNGDGRGDLLCKFVTSRTGLTTASKQAFLTAKKKDGSPIAGSDKVAVGP